MPGVAIGNKAGVTPPAIKVSPGMKYAVFAPGGAEAVDIAIKAAAFTTAEALSQDIKELVPPIMEHSRELQMDPEHMASHKWFKYLKVTPKAERVWTENKTSKPVAPDG